MTAAGVVLGTLNLNDGPAALAAGADYCFEVLADGFDPGSPEAVRVVAASMLLDGDDERIDRWGRRQHTLKVRTTGKDVDSLHAAQQALTKALTGDPLTGRTMLTVTIPGASNPTVYDVLNGDQALSMTREDQALLALHNKHTWTLELACLPWARGATKQITTFAPTSASQTETTNATLLANWSSAQNGVGGSTATLSSQTWLTEAAVRGIGVNVSWNGSISSSGVHLTWTPTWLSGNFVWYDLAPDGWKITEVLLWEVGTTNVHFPRARTLTATGFMRYFFDNPGVPSYLRVTLEQYSGSTAGTNPTVYMAGFGPSSILPNSGVLLLNVPGSVRTQGTITIPFNGTSLSQFLYTDLSMEREGWSPGTPSTWPDAPAGCYSIWRTKPANGSKSVAITSGSGVTRTLERLVTSADAARLSFGTIRLGGTRDGRLGNLSFNLDGAGATSSPANTWIFREADEAQLSYLSGTLAGGGHSLVIEAPSLDMPEGGAFLDGVDAQPYMSAWGVPVLVPPVTAIWPATDMTVEVYAHDHTFAA